MTHTLVRLVYVTAASAVKCLQGRVKCQLTGALSYQLTTTSPYVYGTPSTRQVRHSGNFSNGNPFVTQSMGGINYQIEHHLFPSMSHMLYAEIAPIVKDACEEFNIPYK